MALEAQSSHDLLVLRVGGGPRPQEILTIAKGLMELEAQSSHDLLALRVGVR